MIYPDIVQFAMPPSLPPSPPLTRVALLVSLKVPWAAGGRSLRLSLMTALRYGRRPRSDHVRSLMSEEGDGAQIIEGEGGAQMREEKGSSLMRSPCTWASCTWTSSAGPASPAPPRQPPWPRGSRPTVAPPCSWRWPSSRTLIYEREGGTVSVHGIGRRLARTLRFVRKHLPINVEQSSVQLSIYVWVCPPQLRDV